MDDPACEEIRRADANMDDGTHMNRRDSLIDTVYDGRYYVRRRIGSGGMANVYLADDQTLGRDVAIKVLSPRFAEDDQFVERFMREASSAARLNHPNIVQVYDRGQAAGSYYIAMEYVEGETLKELIQRDGPVPRELLFDYTRQALGALRFAHRNGVVHRDIKPHNMMIDTEGRLKIADFGIARAGADQGLTEVGSIVGTAQYLSPEQARGETVSAASDLYSIGIVMYEMATGQVPYEGDSPVNVALKHVNDPVPRPSQVRRDVPPALEAVIVRALQKDPHDRYQTADEFLADLERARRGVLPADTSAMTQVLGGAGASTMPTIARHSNRPPAPVPSDVGAAYAASKFDEAPDPRAKRSRWPWVLLALLVLALVGVAYLVTASSPETSPVPDVTGKRVQQARTQLEGAGFRVGEVQQEFSDEEPAGRVISQDPEAGNEAEAGEQIDLVVSRGPEPVTVPDLVGEPVGDARSELQEAGLEIREQAQITDEEDPGTVLSQDPAAGKQVAPGSTVTVTVARTVPEKAVPSVVGLDEASARDRLKAAGFAVDTREVDSGEPQGQVVAQDPEAGSEAKQGATVSLQVASGYNTVPGVVGQTAADAKAALRAAGFAVREEREMTNDPSLPPSGTVTSQDPAAEARFRLGERVTIVVTRHEEPAADDEEPQP